MTANRPSANQAGGVICASAERARRGAEAKKNIGGGANAIEAAAE
jgi:hypothetical protein